MDRQLRLASLRDEWLASPVTSKTAADLEASGLLYGMKHTSSAFTTNRLTAARRLTGPGKFPLWPLTSYAAKFPIQISMTSSPHHKPSVKFSCPLAILKLPKTLRTSWAWLKGLWASAGGLYFPKTGYYLTIIISDTQTSQIAQKAMSLTGLAWRNHRHEYTLRNYDDIMTFLCNAGMPSGALDLDKTALMRSVKNRATLESNYDSANITRSLTAARNQSALAAQIISLGLLDTLPANLRDLVSLRLDYPDESLTGLGKRLNPAITKAAVNYRWRKVQEILDSATLHTPAEKSSS